LAKRWDIVEDQYLLDNYQENSDSELAVYLERSAAAVKLRRNKLGLKLDYNKLLTTEEYKAQIQEKSMLCISEYGGNATPILHKCKKCGNEQKATPSNVKQGRGCNECACNKKLTTDQYRVQIRDKSLICLEEYINDRTHILHQCKKCGNEQEMQPYVVKNGHACKKCANFGFNPGKPSHLYLLDVAQDEEHFLKLGVTNREVATRVAQIKRTCTKGTEISIVVTLYCGNGQVIHDLEQSIHNNKELKRFTTNNIKMDGRTELYDYAMLSKLKAYFNNKLLITY
jgi:hypothetical protein